MKRLLVALLSFSVFTLPLFAQPRLSANKSMHNFGQVEWKQPVTANYTITNTGDKPLVLSNITTSCACTDVNWTKTPIAPGAKGDISVTFDAEALGRFDRSIVVYSNSNPRLVYFRLSCGVCPKINSSSTSSPYEMVHIQL